MTQLPIHGIIHISKTVGGVKIENKHNHLELGQDAIVGCKMQVASEMQGGSDGKQGVAELNP